MKEWCRSRRASLATAVMYVAFGRWSLSRVPSGWWRWRDDAVITLSHARGLAAYGYPAVSAAAERVEGTSAPLQMFAAAIFYGLGGHGWAGFLDVQVLLGFALTGWFSARLLSHSFPTARAGGVAACSMVAAVVGFSTWQVLGWFGSGMENSLTIPVLLAVAATATGVLTGNDHRGWACGAAIGLAGIVRVEFAVFMFPVLAIVVAMLWRSRRGAAYRVAGLALLIWTVLHAWRWLTFHSFIPNTALAQGKHSIDLGNLFWIGVVAVAASSVMLVWRRPQWRVLTSTALGVASAAVAISALSTSSSTSAGGLPTGLVLGLAGLWTVASTAWMAGLGTPEVWAPLMAVGSVPVIQELLLGPARLDTTRIGAQALPVLAVVLGWPCWGWQHASPRCPDRAPAPNGDTQCAAASPPPHSSPSQASACSRCRPRQPTRSRTTCAARSAASPTSSPRAPTTPYVSVFHGRSRRCPTSARPRPGRPSRSPAARRCRCRRDPGGRR